MGKQDLEIGHPQSRSRFWLDLHDNHLHFYRASSLCRPWHSLLQYLSAPATVPGPWSISEVGLIMRRCNMVTTRSAAVSPEKGLSHQCICLLVHFLTSSPQLWSGELISHTHPPRPLCPGFNARQCRLGKGRTEQGDLPAHLGGICGLDCISQGLQPLPVCVAPDGWVWPPNLTQCSSPHALSLQRHMDGRRTGIRGCRSVS